MRAPCATLRSALGCVRCASASLTAAGSAWPGARSARALALAYNVAGVLGDPTLSIYRHDSVLNTDELILTNDDWSMGPGAQRTRDVATQINAFALPEGSNDAAFVVTLNPGVYTVHARGANNTTGVALVEVYAVP